MSVSDNLEKTCFYILFLAVIHFLHLHRTNLERQSEQINEPVRIMMVIQIAGREACKGFTVQRIWGSRSGFDDITFIELELHFTGHILLSALYKCLNGLAKRCEPFALIYDLRQLVAHRFFYFVSGAV